MSSENPNKKRATEQQLTKDEYKASNDDAEETPKGEKDGGDFVRATEDELKGRVIRRVKRCPTAATTTGDNPFANVVLTAPTKEQEPEEKQTTPEPDVQSTKARPVSTPEPKPPQKTPEKADEGEESGDVIATSSIFGSVFKTSSLFSARTSEAGASGTPMQTFSDVTPMQPLEQVISGEEDEETKYTEKVAIYFNVSGEWRATGRGELKINVGKDGGARLLMRHHVTMKVVLNARLYPEMKAMEMGGNAVSFSCRNTAGKDDMSEENGEGDKYDIVAVRFKADSQKKAEELKAAIDLYKV